VALSLRGDGENAWFAHSVLDDDGNDDDDDDDDVHDVHESASMSTGSAAVRRCECGYEADNNGDCDDDFVVEDAGGDGDDDLEDDLEDDLDEGDGDLDNAGGEGEGLDDAAHAV
jgi:hypothetical protein